MELRLLRYFVAVAEERHIGRAAARLHMTQPPLSRAIRRLEDRFGVVLLQRIPSGIALTPAGEALLDGARGLLEHADRLSDHVTAAAGQRRLVVGTLADAAEQVGTVLVSEFRRRNPGIEVTIHEADLGDPTAGLRAELVDVALTREPFDGHGITTHRLWSEAVGMVMREDDPLAGRDVVRIGELGDRRWVRLPAGTDPVWCAYWTGCATGEPEPGLTKRTIQECLQSVLWNGMSALAPLNQGLPAGLTVVPVADRPPSHLVVAWRASTRNPLVRSFVEVVAHVFAERRAGNLCPDGA